jgi:hypothetical protein
LGRPLPISGRFFVAVLAGVVCRFSCIRKHDNDDAGDCRDGDAGERHPQPHSFGRTAPGGYGRSPAITDQRAYVNAG